jgi:calcineurin-like phosphoesterase
MLPGIITLVGLLTISMLPLILVILGFIATLGVLAVYWVKHFDDIKSGMDGFMEEWNGFFDMIVAKQQSSTTVLGMTWEEYFKNVRVGMGVMWDAIFKIIFQGVNNNINLMEGLINSIINMIDNLLGRINRVGRRVADFLGKDFKSIELIGNIELPRITQEVFLKKAKQDELGFIGPMNQSVGQPSSQNINSNTMDIGGSTIPMARTRSQVPAVNINIQQMIGEEEYAEKMGDKIIQSLKQNQLMTSI